MSHYSHRLGVLISVLKFLGTVEEPTSLHKYKAIYRVIDELTLLLSPSGSAAVCA